jgi:hypothetical protein
MSNGRDDIEIAPSRESVNSEAAAFAASINPSAEAQAVDAEMNMPLESLVDEGDIEVESTWADGPDKGQKLDDIFQAKSAASKPATPESPAQTIKFKANGEDIELPLEEAQKRLSLAEGARQALQDRAKLSKENKLLQEQAKELAKYKDTWDKLESVKHDRQKLFEMITGEPYDDLIRKESERREIYQNGTEEQKQLLAQAERVQRLEREIELEKTRKDSESKRIDQQRYEAEKQQVRTVMEKEFYKHDLPTDLAPAAQSKLKAMLWKQSTDDLKQYHKEYGKITNKMVEKAFADNAALLKGGLKASVDKQVADVREATKQSAKENAQLASTKNSGTAIDPKLASMNPSDLFKFFQKGK